MEDPWSTALPFADTRYGELRNSTDPRKLSVSRTVLVSWHLILCCDNFSCLTYYAQIWVVGEYSGCTSLTLTHSDVILKYHEVSGAIPSVHDFSSTVRLHA